MHGGSGERMPRATVPMRATGADFDAVTLLQAGWQDTARLQRQGRLLHYRCEGCGAQQDQVRERVLALSQADEHASKCRAIPDPVFERRR